MPTQEKPKPKLCHDKAEKQSKRDRKKNKQKEYMDLARTSRNAGHNLPKFTFLDNLYFVNFNMFLRSQIVISLYKELKL